MSCSLIEATATTAQNMEDVGRRLGELLLSSPDAAGPAIVFLRGPLGAGKTTLARGVLRAFGVDGIVKSPTYTLVETYETVCGSLVHIDLYRLNQVEEVEYLGLEGYLESAVCLFEWPERAVGALPQADLEIIIDADRDPRRLSISAMTARGAVLAVGLGARLQFAELISKT